MRPSYIIVAGVAVAAAVAYFAFRGTRRAEAQAGLEKLYARKIPKIPFGMKWNPGTGEISRWSRSGKDHF